VAQADKRRRSRRRPPPTARKSTHGSLDWVREQAHRQIGYDAWPREVFADRLIVEHDNGLLDERPWSVADGELVLGEPTAVSLEYVAKAEGGPRLTGPFVAKDEAKRLVYSAVLVPGEPDADGDELSAEKIEQVAHEYLAAFRAIDTDHDVEQIDATPVESYIEPADREVEVDGEAVTLPAGTWTMAVKVHDDATWERVTGGELSGFSIMGVPASTREKALEAVKSGGMAACKRTTLADLGGGDPNGDWIVPFVSLVDRPAVPKAKFFAVKSAEKAGRRYAAATAEQIAQLQELVNTLAADVEAERESKAGEAAGKEEAMDEEKVKALIEAAVPNAVSTAVDEKLTPISEKLEALSASGGNGAPAAGDGEQIPEAVKSRLEELTEKVDRLQARTRATSRQPDEQPVETAVKGLASEYDAYGRRIKR